MLKPSFFSPVPPYARAESFPRRSVRSASARSFSSFSLSCARLSRRSHQLHHSLQIVRERGEIHLHPRPLHSQIPYPRHPAPALHRTKRRFHEGRVDEHAFLHHQPALLHLLREMPERPLFHPRLGEALAKHHERRV